jgi:hypothetical protein
VLADLTSPPSRPVGQAERRRQKFFNDFSRARACTCAEGPTMGEAPRGQTSIGRCTIQSWSIEISAGEFLSPCGLSRSFCSSRSGPPLLAESTSERRPFDAKPNGLICCAWPGSQSTAGLLAHGPRRFHPMLPPGLSTTTGSLSVCLSYHRRASIQHWGRQASNLESATGTDVLDANIRGRSPGGCGIASRVVCSPGVRTCGCSR